MKFYTRQRRTPSVIIVSLIDILAILLIFVIVTTTFKKSQPEVAIKLPSSSTASSGESHSEILKVTIAPDGKLFLANQPVTEKELSAGLKKSQASNPQRPIALRADDKAPFGVIIKVLDILKEAGVQSNVSAFVENRK